MDPDEKNLDPNRIIPPPSPATDPTADAVNSTNPNPPEKPNSQSPPSRNPNSPAATVPPDATMKVFLRIRPHVVSPPKGRTLRLLNDKIAWPKAKQGVRVEKAKTEIKKTSCVQVCDCHSVTISPPSSLNRMKSEVYRGFSQVFSEDSSQEEVYAEMVSPIVEEFLGGMSGLLAALGPSGSGKTHTVFGSGRDPGLVPRALRHIFRPCDGSQDRIKRSFYLSMFEIYVDNGKEKLSDLSPDGGDVQLQQSSLKGLKELLITDYMQAESLIARGMLRRAIAMTNSNSQSSRSQCIINIRRTIDNIDGKVETQVNESVLTFVDLAGAEREKKTGNQGDRLLQSNFINKTSMVFGLCLRSLLEHQKNPKKPLRKHFQSSLLTRYLRDYLEGKKRMALILTVRPAEEDYLDTSFLLRQASPFMEIKFLSKDERSQSKRQHDTTVNVVPEQSKRMKISCPTESMDKLTVSTQRSDTCEELDEGYPRKVPAKPRKVMISKVNDDITCKTICADSEKERDYKILLGVSKSIWSLLKEQNKKIKVLDKRNLELEKELSDLKSCSCVSQKEPSVEVGSLVADTNSETTSLAKELVGHKSAGSNSEGEIDVSKDMEKQADVSKTGFDCLEEQNSTSLRCKRDMEPESNSYSSKPVRLPEDHISDFHEANENEKVVKVEGFQPTNTRKSEKKAHVCKTECEHPQDECQVSQNFEGNVNDQDSYQECDLEKKDNKETCSGKKMTEDTKEFVKKAHTCQTESEELREECRGSQNFEGCDLEKEDNKETCSGKTVTENEKELEKKAHICKTEFEQPQDECHGSQNFEEIVNYEDSYQGCHPEKEDNKETCSDKNLTEDAKELEKKAHICKKESEHPQDEFKRSQSFEGHVKNEDSYQGHELEKEDNNETCSDKKLAASYDEILKSSSDQTNATASKRGGQGTNKKGKQKKHINCDSGDNFASASKPGKSLNPKEKTSVKTKPKRRLMPVSAAASLAYDSSVGFRDEESAVGGRSGRKTAGDNRHTSGSAALLHWLRVDVHH